MQDAALTRRDLLAGTAALGVTAAIAPRAAQAAPASAAIDAAMLGAARYMVEKVSHQGGYVWQVLLDRSREWGEMQAYPTSVWIQNPGTPLMGQVFLDAYHATGDAYFYQAAAKAADVLIRGQHESGGWNYHFDLAGERSIRRWYDTVGKNGWRLEEFQHYYGNATYDDSCTADCAKFMLRMYLEKREPRYRAALDKVLGFVLASQYPVGGWPQRFPLRDEFHDHGLPDYTSFITFNDDVAAENIVFLLMVWQTLGDARVLDPIARAMDCFVRAQQPQPQPGWGLQHSVADLKPASARTYEPEALVSHTTATNVALMMDFYELTGERKFLDRLPEALDWLDSIRLPATIDPQRRYPTFIKVGANTPMYIHRRGSDVVNGEYYHDGDPHNTIAHYSSFRSPDVAALRARLAVLSARPVAEVTAGSALKGGRRPLPRYFTLRDIAIGDLKTTATHTIAPSAPGEAAAILAALDAEHRWVTPLHTTSHAYTRDGYATPVPGDFSHTYVGDDTDTSPFPDPRPVPGISTAVFAKNMGVLIRARATA
ncbi:pectate lyase [Sphingomonas sp. H39-1-10]|uniref:pectate lyase n=1 Tax=Sphingomonas pollutisoli TaxID=3030829 RepID=UPI0023B88AAB|nr:pectate lyase [Sphingomonas pollutisoli]MDF0487321.1 pectate lyase [Sphingomonas pollutisoli]